MGPCQGRLCGLTVTETIAAIREQNHDVEVQDRGSYLRVLAAGRCVITRQAVERILGLGRSLGRSAVEAHGGAVALAEKAGPGARFRFTLPAA